MGSNTTRALAIGILLSGLAAGQAHALDMVVGDVTVANLGSYGFDAQGTESPASETGVLTFDSGVTDELFQMFGYLGTASGHVRIDSTSFNVSSAISQAGTSAVSQLTLSAAGAAALGLTTGAITVDYKFDLIDDTSAQDVDRLGWDITLTNTTASAIDVSLYTYLDLDLGGAADFGDDLASSNLSRMTLTDADDPTALFVWSVGSGTADHFQVGTYPSVRTALNNMTSAQDLNDTSATFGPSDFSGAYQFDRSLAAFGSQTIQLNTRVVPEPQPALLTGLGLVGLAFYGRRRVHRRPR